MQKISGPTDVHKGLLAPTIAAKVPTQQQSVPAPAAPAAPVPATTGQGTGQ